MSQENVEVAQRGIDAWNRGDLEEMLELLHPEVELTPVIAQLVEGGEAVYKGISGARRFWEDWRIAWDFRFDEIELRDLGDAVLMLSRVTVTGRDELDLETPMAAVYTFRDGRVIKMTSYLDPAEALKAVGLAE